MFLYVIVWSDSGIQYYYDNLVKDQEMQKFCPSTILHYRKGDISIYLVNTYLLNIYSPDSGDIVMNKTNYVATFMALTFYLEWQIINKYIQ